jgi:hypothetical protein
MKVFVLIIGYEYGGVREVKSFDSLSKCKKFCEEVYGLSQLGWTVNSKGDIYFYDGDIDRIKMEMSYDLFEIYSVEVM